MVSKQLNYLMNSTPGTVCHHLYIQFNFMELMLSDMKFYQLANCPKKLNNAKNKNFKNYREHHTRKLSRVKIDEDLINMLLVSSDPLISSMRNIQPKKLQTFSDDAKLLIIMPEEQASDSCKSESDDDLE
uniref:Uncharacterized protein n=1 Tax=Sipha flava TaxID=143950 RepID=A0A2S2PY87_9HEMI